MKRTKSMTYKPTPESDNLYLYIRNTSDMYHRYCMPLVENYKKKYEKGVYDQDRAIEGWYYVADAGAKMYAKEFPEEGNKFSVSDRWTVASDLEEYFYEEYIAK